MNHLRKGNTGIKRIEEPTASKCMQFNEFDILRETMDIERNRVCSLTTHLPQLVSKEILRKSRMSTQCVTKNKQTAFERISRR